MNEWTNERTNKRTNGSNCGDERNSNKRMKTSLGKKRAHFDNGFVYGGQRYLRGSVGIWRAIAAGSPRKARTLTCANQHKPSANNARIYRFVPLGTFISPSLFLIFPLNYAVLLRSASITTRSYIIVLVWLCASMLFITLQLKIYEWSRSRLYSVETSRWGIREYR